MLTIELLNIIGIIIIIIFVILLLQCPTPSYPERARTVKFHGYHIMNDKEYHDFLIYLQQKLYDILKYKEVDHDGENVRQFMKWVMQFNPQYESFSTRTDTNIIKNSEIIEGFANDFPDLVKDITDFNPIYEFMLSD